MWYTPAMDSSKKWYQKTWAAILFLFLFFPVGLYLMWKYTGWPKVAKWVITGFFGLMVLGSAMGGNTKTASTTVQPTQAPQQQEAQATVEPTTAQATPIVKATNTPVAKQAVKPTTPPVSNTTVSQKNALRKAQSYLAYTAFSHDGLVAQLEYEQFSHEDAVYGADNVGANWSEQAAKKAKSYMDMQGYSRDGLIEQLKYEKFTQEQAEYGASAVGL